MTLRRYWSGMTLAAVVAFVAYALWIGPWWRSVRPHPGKQAIPIKAEWFHARSLERDGDKWGMHRVGYTDIDYEYVASNVFEAGSSEVGFKKTVINELGGRGILPTQLKNGPERVVIIGDSFAFGRGLEEHETLASQLRRVHVQQKGRDLHVYNLAVGGYSFWSTMEVLSAKAVFLNPDRILYVTYNRDNDASGLRHARTICESLDIAFEVAFQPAWTKGEDHVGTTNDFVKKVCLQAGVRFHDFSAAMSGPDKSRWVASDGHPSVEANQMAAQTYLRAWGEPGPYLDRRVSRARMLVKSFPYIEGRLLDLQSGLRDQVEQIWIAQRLEFYKQLNIHCEKDVKE